MRYLLEREQRNLLLETLKTLVQTPAVPFSPGTALLVQVALVAVKWLHQRIVGHQVTGKGSTKIAVGLI